MPRPLRPSERRFLQAGADACASVAAVTLALWTWSLTAGEAWSMTFLRQEGWWYAAVPLWVVALAPTRRVATALSLSVTAIGISRACVALLVTYLAAYFYFGPDVLPRLMALYVLWNAAWLTFGSRLVLAWALTQHPFTKQVVVVGDGPAADAAGRVIGPGARLAGRVPADDPAVDRAVAALGAHEVIVAVQAPMAPEGIEQLLRCQEQGIDVVTLAHAYEQVKQGVPVRYVGPEWLITELFTGAGPRDASPLAKRGLDVIAAVALGVLGTPLALLAAAAIWLESGRPVFYSQVRLGRGGRSFRLTKLRTMRPDAEASGPQWSTPGDPRITPVGAVLRRTHIDELPNLWAVLKGDMSMVGPRPERPEFIDLLTREVPLYRARLIVDPGLTGWAQVNTQYGDSVEDAVTKLEYDLYYVRHRSFWLDVAILLRTVGRMVGWKGR